jgi:GABA(A) receptor-associated protein
MDYLLKKFRKKSTSNISYYKQQYPFEKRKNDSERILAKYPDRIPIIVERFGDNVPEIDRKKYLVPDDLSMCNFMYVIRKRLKLEPEKALYLFINSKIVTGTKNLTTIYNKYQDEDGFLYIKYSGETTFG